jgi:5'-3' exonuclease
VVVCCDSGRSFRRDISPDYKATRPDRNEVLVYQGDLARETLADDGYTVLAANGFEADDLVATACTWLRSQNPPHEVVIATADKDLCQLVGDGVVNYNLTSNSIRDAAGVKEKYGVTPEQMGDWLALVGDSSDNIKGAPGIGEKTAAGLLGKFGSLVGIYCAIEGKTEPPAGFKPATFASLRDHQATVSLARKLVTLRTDAPIDFTQLLAERAPKDLKEDTVSETDTTANTEAPEIEAEIVPPVPAPPAQPTVASTKPNGNSKTAEFATPPSAALVTTTWERSLEPTDLGTAYKLAQHLHNSRLFSAYGNADAVMSVILSGRSLGLDAMTALRSIHLVEGKPTMSAQLMVGLVLRSGKAEYFDLVESTDEKATYVTLRKGRTTPVQMSFSMEDARRAGVVKEKSGWAKFPRAMLRARAASDLCRAVYPDICANVYTPDELGAYEEVA